MDMQSELRFDSDPVAVFEMLTDENYIARKTQAANAVDHHVKVTRDGELVTINLTRVMPPDVPDFVRKFVGDTIDVKQIDTWDASAADGSRRGTISLELVGAPVTCTGTLSLVPDGTGTRVTISGQLRASVPLFGGKIEQAVHQGLMHVAKVEQRVGTEWLAGRRSG